MADPQFIIFASIFVVTVLSLLILDYFSHKRFSRLYLLDKSFLFMLPFGFFCWTGFLSYGSFLKNPEFNPVWIFSFTAAAVVWFCVGCYVNTRKTNIVYAVIGTLLQGVLSIYGIYILFFLFILFIGFGFLKALGKMKPAPSPTVYYTYNWDGSAAEQQFREDQAISGYNAAVREANIQKANHWVMYGE